jgi:hypothetical protein
LPLDALHRLAIPKLYAQASRGAEVEDAHARTGIEQEMERLSFPGNLHVHPQQPLTVLERDFVRTLGPSRKRQQQGREQDTHEEAHSAVPKQDLCDRRKARAPSPTHAAV